MTIIALARPPISGITSSSKMRSITSALYWIRPSSWKATFLSALATTPFGIQLLLVGLWHDVAMQIVERLVGNDARRDIDDVAFGDGLGLAVGIERLAEQGDGGRRGRGGERDEELVEVVLADDLGESVLPGLAPAASASGSSVLRNGKRMAAPIWPSCERCASSIRKATRRFFRSGFFLISSSTQANFCCVVTMIGLRSLRNRGRSSAFRARPTTSLRCVKFSMSSLIFVSRDLRSVRMKTRSTSFSFVPGLNRLCSRSASQQIESVLPLPAEWLIRYLRPMSPVAAKCV